MLALKPPATSTEGGSPTNHRAPVNPTLVKLNHGAINPAVSPNMPPLLLLQVPGKRLCELPV